MKRFLFGEDVDKSIVSPFYDTPCTPLRVAREE